MTFKLLSLCCALATGLVAGTSAFADAPSAPSKHQMMKDCMAKQKASDSGMPKEQMKKNCRDVVNMKSENAAVEKNAEQKGGSP